jgi:hypothetical protein
VVGAVVMLYGIAFLTITIAAITSTFVARAEREQMARAGTEERLEWASTTSRRGWSGSSRCSDSWRRTPAAGDGYAGASPPSSIAKRGDSHDQVCVDLARGG